MLKIELGEIMEIYKKFVIMFSVSLAVFSGIVLTTEAFNTQPASQSQPIDYTSSEESYYTVKEHNGKIAVFNQNGVNPIHIFENPYVRDLPEYDRKLLKNGITVYSNEELLKILEDYDN